MPGKWNCAQPLPRGIDSWLAIFVFLETWHQGWGEDSAKGVKGCGTRMTQMMSCQEQGIRRLPVTWSHDDSALSNRQRHSCRHPISNLFTQVASNSPTHSRLPTIPQGRNSLPFQPGSFTALNMLLLLELQVDLCGNGENPAPVGWCLDIVNPVLE